ncbi:CheR family methyltransferase [Pseudomonadota bacterium]
MKTNDLNKIETKLLLSAIKQRYGYDFEQYAKASLNRRLKRVQEIIGVEHLSQMIPMVLHDEEVFETFLRSMSVVVTEMFRNPEFFSEFRKKVIPILKTYPFVKIWHAGCATGEEVYSTAIILYEEGFYDRAQIYATDYNHHAIKIAMNGHYNVIKFDDYNKNYLEAGGKGSLSDYYHINNSTASVISELKENIVFSHHNLVSDGVFGEMNVVICRNVMIYFSSELQNRVLRLLNDSLCRNGYLCLGDKESLKMTVVEKLYETVCKKSRIYRRKN